MNCLDDFNAALAGEGVPPAYHWDGTALEAQAALPGTLEAHSAFAAGLRALFSTTPTAAGRDDFASMVASQPKAFGLAADPDLAFRLRRVDRRSRLDPGEARRQPPRLPLRLHLSDRPRPDGA
jgi:hypothetical protein